MDARWAIPMAARIVQMTTDPALILTQWLSPTYLFGFISNLVQAAQRLMPLGQTRGQILLAALAPLCDTIGAEAAGASVDDIGTATFAADIASMRHDTLEPRIFRS